MANKSTPKNTTYIAGPITYVIKGSDDYLQVNTSGGAVTIYVPNIMGSGLNVNNKSFFVNDLTGNASVNNITLIATGTDLINGGASITLSVNNISCELVIVNNQEWQGNLSSDGSAGAAAWGSIGAGTGVGSQTDLVNYLNAGYWKQGGNNLSGTPKNLGSTDATDVNLVRGGSALATLSTTGILLHNAFGQPNTGSFSYNATNGRVLIVPNTGSTSGGCIFGIYGTNGGTFLGIPYLDNTFNVTQLVGGLGTQTLFLGATGNLLLGTSSGIVPSARLDIRLFSSSDSNTALSIKNSSSSQLLKVTEAGNFGFNGSSFGGGIKTIFIANATSIPTSNPSGGGILYVEAGDLKYRGASGTITTLAVS